MMPNVFCLLSQEAVPGQHSGRCDKPESAASPIRAILFSSLVSAAEIENHFLARLDVELEKTLLPLTVQAVGASLELDGSIVS